MGLLTAADTKVQLKNGPPKHNFFMIFPQDKIGLLSGPLKQRSAVGSGPLWGKTLTAAPVSTKNVLPEMESVK
jgi:hypothetical protein